MTLYEIDAALLACVDPETGEIIDPEQLDALSMEREAKIEGAGLWVKDLRAEAAAIAEEIKALTERKKAAEKKADSIAEWLERSLEGEKFTTPRVAMTWRKSSAVEIADPEKFIDWAEMENRDEFIDYKATIRKADVKAAIKAGEEIPGASIVEHNNMTIK